jgi:dTDP-4-dehydrorhamnose reductase
MRQLAAGTSPDHPVLQGKGWWRRSERFLCAPVSTPEALASICADGHAVWRGAPAPILITGATGTLGRAFARICKSRNLAYKLLTREEMDITNAESVKAAIARYQPWALINASGYVRVDDAEREVERCMLENAAGPAVLAEACAASGIHFTTFSSDLVFDGRKTTPYIETDEIMPLNVYGVSKASAEQEVLRLYGKALVVRTSAFFGPWDDHNFLVQVLGALERGQAFTASADAVVSPTYVPDLVHCCLDLIIDGEAGIWHLSNHTAVTWSEFAKQAAQLAGIEAGTLVEQASEQMDLAAPRPLYSVLGSARGTRLPSLDCALRRFLAARQDQPEAVQGVYAADSH